MTFLQVVQSYPQKASEPDLSAPGINLLPACCVSVVNRATEFA